MEVASRSCAGTMLSGGGVVVLIFYGGCWLRSTLSSENSAHTCDSPMSPHMPHVSVDAALERSRCPRSGVPSYSTCECSPGLLYLPYLCSLAALHYWDYWATSFLLVLLKTGVILQETTIHRQRQKLRAMTDGLGLGDAYGARLGRIK